MKKAIVRMRSSTPYFGAYNLDTHQGWWLGVDFDWEQLEKRGESCFYPLGDVDGYVCRLELTLVGDPRLLKWLDKK